MKLSRAACSGFVTYTIIFEPSTIVPITQNPERFLKVISIAVKYSPTKVSRLYDDYSLFTTNKVTNQQRY